MSSTENSIGTLSQPLFSAVVSVTEGTPHSTREGKQLNNNNNNSNNNNNNINNNINKFKEEPNGKQKNQNISQQENGNNININIKEEPNGKQKIQNNSQENGKSNVNINTTGRNQQLQVYCDSNDIATADVDAQFINPISFLNTMHQKLKTTAPPEYSFSHDSLTGQFYCQVHFCGQTYQNQIAKPKKQTAKEEVACIAMRDLSIRMPDITNQIRAELVRAHISSQKNKFGGNKKPVGNNINNINNINSNNNNINNINNNNINNINNNNINNNNNGMNGINGINRQSIALQMRPPHPLELVPKSRQWYDKQQQQAVANNRQKKRPCVLLLEFCQMHKLGHPVYNIRDDGRGNYLFDCTINERIFTPEVAFWQKNDAKDHVSTIAFNVLFKEICERESMEIQYRHPHFQPQPPPPPPLPPLPHNQQQPHIGVPTYGNVMAMYPPNDGGYIANNMSLVPANYVFTNSGNNGQNHALIPRNS